MKILLADDHSILRQGLIQILADAFPKAEFGEAGPTQETIARLGEKSWDVICWTSLCPAAAEWRCCPKYGSVTLACPCWC